ncbi:MULTISPECIES: DUF4139 domain-containing protein [unclassified Brevundimonas]|uniref:DUF4139 domain-containing protein n=1 Tax=unclassified Brevundimonas TaxID=2622653 RepID=UPI0025C220F3|nr:MULTISPECIES: hypothetical protein [unclassified Brevundimonas]
MRPLCAVLACAVAWGPLAAAALPAIAQETGVSRAEAVSERPGSVSVVVYRDRPVDTGELLERSRQSWSRLDLEGLALIVEKRVVDVPAGEGVIRFKGLATGIVPHSATVEGLPAELLEQNADYDLISPANLLERAIGETVTVVRTNAGNGEVVEQSGVLRAGTNGAVVEIDGRFEALDCSGLTERLVFETVPEGLGATPTLSIRTRAEQAGRYEVTLAYLATGLQWSADYVARVSADESTINLEGWITLANFGGTSFADAPVLVVAGDLSRDADTRPIEVRTRIANTTCWPQQRSHEGWERYATYHGPPAMMPPPPPPPPAPGVAMRMMVEEIVVTGSRIKAELQELGDYKAYVIPHRTTVAARQTKQVLFLAQDNVAVERVVVLPFSPAVDTAPADFGQIELRAPNIEAKGLGIPVPEGGVAFYVATADQPTAYAGSDTVSDTAVGLPVRFSFQTATGITSKVVVTGDESRGRGARKRQVDSHRITLANTTGLAVDVEMPVGSWETGARGFRIEREGLRSQIDADTGQRVWRTRLAAGETRTFDVRWSYDDPE